MSVPHDPLAAYRPTPGHAAAFLLGAAVVLLYPGLLELALARAGVRVVAAALLGATTLGFLWRGKSPELPLRIPRGARVVFLAPLAIALATGDARFLRLVPALIQLGLAGLFASSLRDPTSLVERMARVLQPRAPDFIAPYCRRVTALWAALFLLNAVAIGGLVFAPSPETARWFSAYGVWLVLGATSAVEYCVRKAHFRYYEPTGIDRLWALLLPAEETARGRRSLAFIDAKKAEMRAAGLTPPGEEAGAR